SLLRDEVGAQRCMTSLSIFSATVVSHSYPFGSKLCDYIHQVFLSSHHLMDIFVCHWCLIHPSSKQCNSFISKQSIKVICRKSFNRLCTAHQTARAMGCRCNRRGRAFSTNQKTRRSHGTGNNAQDTFGGRGSSFAMNDNLLSVPFFFPSKIMMILYFGK